MRVCPLLLLLLLGAARALWLPGVSEDGWLEYAQALGTQGSVRVALQATPSSEIPGQIQVLVLHDTALLPGLPQDLHARPVCCTQRRSELKLHGCSVPGSLILPEALDPIFNASTPVRGHTQLDLSFSVEEPRFVRVLVANCFSDEPRIDIQGSVLFQSSYGLLPGQFYPLLQLYKYLLILAAVAGVFWGGILFLARRDLVQMHAALSAVFGSLIVVYVFWFWYFSAFNRSGAPSVALAVFACLFASAQGAAFRGLVTALCLGYGAVRSDFGAHKKKISILTGAHFVLEFSISVWFWSSRDPLNNQSLAFFLEVPSLLLDSYIFWWLYLSISRTSYELLARNQTVKLSLYLKLKYCFFAALGCAVILQIYRFFALEFRDETRIHWRSFWAVSGGFYQVVYALLMGAILAILQPSGSLGRYQMVQQVANSVDDDPELEMKRSL